MSVHLYCSKASAFIELKSNYIGNNDNLRETLVHTHNEDPHPRFF